MFIIDKDMERVMLAKKKEVLHEIETAKKRVLKELYCLKRSIHTDMCEMIADYNRIQFNINKLTEDCKAEVKNAIDRYLTILADTIEQYNIDIDAKLEFLNQREQEITTEVNSKLSELEQMETTVSGLIEQVQNLIENGVVSAEDFNEFKAEMETALESAGVQSDWNEGDPTSKAYVLNRTHYNEFTGTLSGVENVTFSADIVNDQFSVYLLVSNGIFAEGDFCALIINNDTIGSTDPDNVFVNVANYEIQTVRVDPEDPDNLILWEGELEGITAKFVQAPFSSTKRKVNVTYTNPGILRNFSLGFVTQNVKRLDPVFLAPLEQSEGFLYLVDATTCEWRKDFILVSPNGTKYTLTVSDDGALSATAVTE